MQANGRRQYERHRQRGLTLVEVGVALVLATMAALAVVELVAAAAGQQRAGRQRQLALLEAANQAERLALLPWEACAPGELTTWTPSKLLAAEIPSAECAIAVTEDDGVPPLRRIDLSIVWTTAAGQSPAPIRLSLWKFRSASEP